MWRPVTPVKSNPRKSAPLRRGNNAPTRPRTTTPGDLTHADLVILALLAQHPTHGYDLVAVLERQGEGGRAPVSRAQIYYSLKKLIQAEYLRAVPDKHAPAGPEREPYRLTASGHRAMSAALAPPAWSRQRPPIPFHTWLMVLGQAEPADRARALASRRGQLAEDIETESSSMQRLRADPAPDAAVSLAVASHRLEVLRLELQLLEAVEPMLGKRDR